MSGQLDALVGEIVADAARLCPPLSPEAQDAWDRRWKAGAYHYSVTEADEQRLDSERGDA